MIDPAEEADKYITAQIAKETYEVPCETHDWRLVDERAPISSSVVLHCFECPATKNAKEVLDLVIEYERIVKVGVAILIGELETHRKDLEEASGELMLPMPAPGSDDAKLMRANSIMRQQRDRFAADGHELKRALFELENAARSHPDQGGGPENQAYDKRIATITAKYR